MDCFKFVKQRNVIYKIINNLPAPLKSGRLCRNT